MVLGSELGSISSEKAKKKLGNKKAWWTAMSRATRSATDRGRHAICHAAGARGAPYGGSCGSLSPWRFAWRVTWRTAWKTATHGKSCGARSGGVPHSFTGSGVPDMFFAFLALPVEFFSLLITKNCYILRFISKDPSRGHLRRSRPSRLVAVQP